MLTLSIPVFSREDLNEDLKPAFAPSQFRQAPFPNLVDFLCVGTEAAKKETKGTGRIRVSPRRDSLSKIILQGTLLEGGRSTLWLAEEMLDGQRERVDFTAQTRAAHKGLLQKGLEENLC